MLGAFCDGTFTVGRETVFLADELNLVRVDVIPVDLSVLGRLEMIGELDGSSWSTVFEA